MLVLEFNGGTVEKIMINGTREEFLVSGELNLKNDFRKEFDITIPSSLTTSKVPMITTYAKLQNDKESDEDTAFMEVMAFGNIEPETWSYKNEEDGHNISRYLHISRSKANITKVFITSPTRERVVFRIVLDLKEINLGLDKPTTKKLSFDSPILFKFDNVNNARMVRVKVERTDIESLVKQTEKREGCSHFKKECACNIVAIQNLDTPFRQLENDVAFESEWQTMIGRAVIDIDLGENNKNKGFYLVIIRKRDIEDCMVRGIASSMGDDVDEDLGGYNVPTKNILNETSYNFQLQITELYDSNAKITGVITGVFFGLLVIMLVLSRLCGVHLTGNVSGKYIDETKPNTEVNEEFLASESTNVIQPMSTINWITMFSGLFYVIPAVQLMLGAQHMSDITGSNDLCYYNFLCRSQSRLFDDYGHVLSNIVYIFVGIYFFVLVLIRKGRRRDELIDQYILKNSPEDYFDKQKMKEAKKRLSGENIEQLNKVGIPEQYGVFYAMAWACILEGILSACYHICPTDESFQFDTTMMYIIIVLLFFKIYQFRNPNITSDANGIFSFIVVMLVFEATGYYDPSGIFAYLFVGTYVIMSLVIIYQMAFKKKRTETMIPVSKNKDTENEKTKLITDAENKPKVGSTARKIFGVLMMIVNIMLGGYFMAKMIKENDTVVSNFILLIFMTNTAGYAAYYITMKLRYSIIRKNKSESINWVTIIYGILALVFAAVGMVFFKGYQEKNTALSPSESRHLNDECTLLIFDKHDIWHLASGFAMLFTFMLILTLEDNNTSTPWSEIPTF